MTDLLIIIRNLVLATILGWLGLEFAPDSTDKDESLSQTPAAASALC